MISADIRKRVDAIVLICIAKAEKHFGRKYNAINVQYNVRGRKGGHAIGDNHIDLNPILFMENQEEYFTQVVPHEVAHCIDSANGDNRRAEGMAGIRFNRNGRMRRAKRSIHGPTWQHIMRVFGLEPDRTHCMDTTNAAVRTKTKYEYKCVKCSKSYFVSSVRHNKQRRAALTNPGGSYYTCTRCGRREGALVFVANRGQVSFEQAREASKTLPTKFTFDHIPPHKLPPKLREEVGLSNVERARKIYGMYNHLGRGVCISKMVDIGLKSTTASTYYQNFRSGK